MGCYCTFLFFFLYRCVFLKDTSKCLFKTRIIFYFWYTFEVRIILLWMSLYPDFYIYKEILYSICLLINEILIAVRIYLWWSETPISRKFAFLKNFFLLVKIRLLHWWGINDFFLFKGKITFHSRYLDFCVFVKSTHLKTCDFIIGINTDSSYNYACFFWILSIIEMVFGQILLYYIANIFNMFCINAGD